MRTLVIVCAIAALAGCGKDSKEKEKAGGDETAAKSSETHECTIVIAPASEPLEVRSSGPTEEEAWTAVCAELPEGRRAECRESEKFSAQVATVTVNGEESKQITLKEKLPQHEAKATSDKSSDEACSEARLDACESAGAEGDCVESGDYEETGRMAKSTRSS